MFSVSVGATAVTGYLTKGVDNKYYEYNYEDLLNSYIDKYFGSPAKLFDDYAKNNLVAYINDKNDYIDYENILDAYIDAYFAKKNFNLNTYMASVEAKKISLDNVIEVTLGSNGKLIFTEKKLTDPGNGNDSGDNDDDVKDPPSQSGKEIIITYTDYSRTLEEVLNIQMTRWPQTDLYPRPPVWQNAKREDVEYYLNPKNFYQPDMDSIVINGNDLRVRSEPNTSSDSEILTHVNKGETYYTEGISEDGIWYKITAHGQTGWVHGSFVLPVETSYTRSMLQFLLLSGSANAKESDLAAVLKGKEKLEGTESAFLEGTAQHNINEVFLVSLALHETGHGTSQLAQGIDFPDEDNLFDEDTVKVYNMFGIGAVDSDPNLKGAEYAYKQRWFTPEEAIIGGARFAGLNYINSSTHQQNTLYKMRWNPANPGTHQYATDIGWALKQTSGIKNLYDQLSSFTMNFEIPRYKED